MENNQRKHSGFWTMAKYALDNINFFRVYSRLDKVKTMLTRVNMELCKLDPAEHVYEMRVKEFNQAMIELTKGRWYATRAVESKSKTDWKKAFDGFNNCDRISKCLFEALIKGNTDKIAHTTSVISSEGTEIKFADSVPLVPEINPIVILKGTDYDMGYQYAQQVIAIYGKWIFKTKAGRNFTEEEKKHIYLWAEQIEKYTPEIINMIKGWAAGATDAGVTMSYEDVLEIWTGKNEPYKFYMGIDTLRALPPLACAGSAAWGRATEDGELYTASSGDYDCTYTVTIVAYPDTGNSYIYTPFSVVGDVPFLGSIQMFGHPAMNSKGLAYVHHGGTPKMLEPRETWGYGLRRAASVLHILRFADNAEEARKIELTYPVGDAGMDSSAVGGFYADKNYGYILECRKNPVLIREAGLLGEEDFLYANNSVAHPDVINTGWIKRKKEKWTWDPHGGWKPIKYASINKWAAPEEKLESILSNVYLGSSRRNKYFFKMLDEGKCHIDLEYMKRLFRKSGTLPEGDWKKICAQYKKTGEWGEISVGNAMNGPIVVMNPKNGNNGVYAMCMGEASRGNTPTSPLFGSFNPIYGETNAFWEIELGKDPSDVAVSARVRAEKFIVQAKTELARKAGKSTYLRELMQLAEIAYDKGVLCEREASKISTDTLFEYSKATRAYTHAQIRALQVYQALVSTILSKKYQ